jgi:environmental stress-induced protein Ves
VSCGNVYGWPESDARTAHFVYSSASHAAPKIEADLPNVTEEAAPASALRVLRASDYRRMPWKNGGGETREVLLAPAGATLNALDWRISLATVASDGPFSVFEGIERTLCVIHGAGLRLQVGDQPAKVITTRSEPYAFRGDVPTNASLVDGTIVDLNVMTRVGRFRHRVRRLELRDTESLQSAANALVVFCLSGRITARTKEHSVQLRAEDALLIEQPMQLMQLVAPGPATLLLIELFAD